MRKHTIMLAAAPLALLAACGDRADEAAETETAEVEPMPEPAATTGGEAPTPIADAGDYSGAYSFTAEDGTNRNVSFDSSDNTYRYTDASGAEQTGDYTITPDGYRLYLADYYGSPAWFVYRNDALDLIRTDMEITPDVTITGDRYQRDGDEEVPSRRPELGSSVDRDQQ